MRGSNFLCCVWLLSLLVMANSLNIDVQNTEQAAALVVNCTSNPIDEREFNLTKLSSLILSHSHSGNVSDFREVASIQSITLHPIDIFYENATADGAFHTDRTSFLSLTWSPPSENAWGTYKCVANGIDSIGHPVSVSNTRHFTRGNFEIFLEEISSLKSELKKLTEDVEGNEKLCWSEIAKMKIELERCDEKIERFVNSSSQRRELLAHALFEIPVVFNGHTYFLSRQEPSLVSTVATATCESLGGYLVHIDDRNEFSFVRDLVKRHAGWKFVLIGGLNESQSGQWLIPFYNGGSGEPDEKGNEHCLAVGVECACVMGDVPCILGDNESLPARFLCEIP
ncbi:unnamed protein product [Lymnaea stagnalis]|uniref:C-type lectin domain-containing protein n=1 Tax=Lymnaea stagnalis TaxID=6523 RepID=A0AAV2H6F8_LYMST